MVCRARGCTRCRKRRRSACGASRIIQGIVTGLVFAMCQQSEFVDKILGPIYGIDVTASAGFCSSANSPMSASGELVHLWMKLIGRAKSWGACQSLTSVSSFKQYELSICRTYNLLRIGL